MDDESRSSLSRTFLVARAAVAGLAFIYFGGFAALLVDELVLKTNWFVSTYPGAIPVLQTIYAPLIPIDRFIVG